MGRETWESYNGDVRQGQQAIAGFRGAIVVMEGDTGRVLALVSYPGFDPNLFEPSNFNSSFQLREMLNNEDIPLLNRATQGAYPAGSTFKIIVAAAALDDRGAENFDLTLEENFQNVHTISYTNFRDIFSIETIFQPLSLKGWPWSTA